MEGWVVPEQGWRKGPWTHEEDKLLTDYVSLHGEGRWSSVARSGGLNRNGKSCRLRWVNYLRPGLKRGQITPQEEGIIIELHALWGNKWSTIARYLPGRTDNEVKNYWRTHFKKKEKSSQKQEKRKSQILRQEQKQQQQQQQQEDDMKGVIPLAEVSNTRMTETQGRQEMVFMYPSWEDLCLPMMFQDVASVADTAAEDGLWSGLWNLDDAHGCADHVCDCNKIALQNQASGFSCGGGDSSDDLYNGGYIF